MSFLYDGIIRNKWLWFHMLAGAFSAKILQFFGLADNLIILIILFFSILWEVIELFTSDINRIYGNHRRFFLDAIGDVFGALIMATIVLF